MMAHSTEQRLIKTFDDFRKSREKLTDIYRSSRQQFSEILAILKDKQNIVLMPGKHEEVVEKALKKDPVVVIAGQINCGKTSFVNELLGGAFSFPTSEVPCTARIVRIRYSEKNYAQLLDPDGAPIDCSVEFDSKKVPDKLIDLGNKERDSELVRYTVEVGIKHEMMQCGLQIVDVPGLNENAALDDLVAECLDGMLQVLIYVIDGKQSLRTADVTFLAHLKTIAPGMDIIYVCNKIERDEAAARMDAPSDSDEDEAQARIDTRCDEKSLAFQKLQEKKLIPEDVNCSDDLEMFHPISCKKIREARRKKETNEYTKAFIRLRETLFTKFTTCVNSHLLKAVGALLSLQAGVFRYFVVEELTQFHNTVSELNELASVVQKCESGIYNSFQLKMEKEWYSKICSILNGLLGKENKQAISTAVEGLEFWSGAENERVEFDGCLVIRDYIIMLLSADFDIRLTALESMLKEIPQQAEASMKDRPDNEQNIVKKHLRNYWGEDHIKAMLKEIKICLVGGLKQIITELINKRYKNESIPTSAKYPSKAWNKEVALVILENIDAKALGIASAAGIKLILAGDHKVRKQQLDEFAKLSTMKLAHGSKQKLRELVPAFSKNICITDALHRTLRHGHVPLERKVAEESGTEVYQCGLWRGVTGMMAKKKLGRDYPPSDFSAAYCYARVLQQDMTLEAESVAFDDQWDFVRIMQSAKKDAEK